jgi:stage IV sporulation protein B
MICFQTPLTFPRGKAASPAHIKKADVSSQIFKKAGENMKEESRPWGYLAAAAMRVVVLLLLLALALSPVTARASELPDTVIPVGRAVGIKLFSDGVVVVGTSEVSTENGKADPAKACGLKEGDIITHINSTEVDSIEEVSALLQ